MLYAIFSHNFVRFSFELLVPESIFLLGRKRREHFALRVAGIVPVYFLLARIWETLISANVGDALFPYVLLYLGYAALTAVPIGFCFAVQPLELLFIVTGGYAVEHMIFALTRIGLPLIDVPFQTYGSLAHLLLAHYLPYVVGTVIIYFLIIRGNRSRNGFADGDLRIALLAIVLLVVAIGLSVYWSYPEKYYGTEFGDVICPAYSFLCCTLVLLMEYYVLRENGMKREQKMMEQMLQMAYTQQKSAKEAIDIINIKCHDLKHQMKALAKMEDARERSEYLQEVQKAVSIYDATYHTGCRALDYVLREKTLLFNERAVEFSCMVDGTAIDFMAPADIYALMGNALDNALERVLQEKEDERIISLQIRRQGEMAVFHLENRCSRTPEFADGLPVTDKADKSRHGFGVRSIRYIAEKYHGELFMKVKQGNFCLDILFPKQ